jgi:hypothetical protein
MLAARDIIRIVAVVIFALGFLCIPNGWPPPNPKSWTSAFSLMAAAGEFKATGAMLCLAGLLLFLLSFIPFPKQKTK